MFLTTYVWFNIYIYIWSVKLKMQPTTEWCFINHQGNWSHAHIYLRRPLKPVLVIKTLTVLDWATVIYRRIVLESSQTRKRTNARGNVSMPLCCHWEDGDKWTQGAYCNGGKDVVASESMRGPKVHAWRKKCMCHCTHTQNNIGLETLSFSFLKG